MPPIAKRGARAAPLADIGAECPVWGGPSGAFRPVCGRLGEVAPKLPLAPASIPL